MIANLRLESINLWVVLLAAASTFVFGGFFALEKANGCKRRSTGVRLFESVSQRAFNDT
jgi:hypothetical protein